MSAPSVYSFRTLTTQVCARSFYFFKPNARPPGGACDKSLLQKLHYDIWHLSLSTPKMFLYTVLLKESYTHIFNLTLFTYYCTYSWCGLLICTNGTKLIVLVFILQSYIFDQVYIIYCFNYCFPCLFLYFYFLSIRCGQKSNNFSVQGNVTMFMTRWVEQNYLTLKSKLETNKEDKYSLFLAVCVKK